MLLVDDAPASTEDPSALIEEARRRTRKRRARIAAVPLAGALGAAVMIGLGGGGGGVAGRPTDLPPAGSGGGGAAARSAGKLFPGAPSTQANGYGVESDACPLAAANRYLPPRSGCVEVVRADLGGNDRTDLIVIYSRLSGRHPSWFAGGPPPNLRHDFVPKAAFLEVVQANGSAASARIPQATATWIDSISRVSNDSGEEIFLEIGRTSSGATMTAYGYQNRKLVPAGVTLAIGGDSASKAGVNCLPGSPPRLIQRTYALIGPTIYGWWRETDITYTWHGPRLVQSAKHSFKRRGAVNENQTSIGPGCTAAGIG